MIAVSETHDPELVDRMTAGTECPPAHLYMGQGHILIAWDDGEPVAAAWILDEGSLGIPEVHLAVPEEHRGLSTLTAIAAFKAWLLENRSHWLRVWTFVQGGRMVGFARKLGFIEAFTMNGDTYLFFPLNADKEVES